MVEKQESGLIPHWEPDRKYHQHPSYATFIKRAFKIRKIFLKGLTKDMHSCCRFYKAHAEFVQVVRIYGSGLLCLTITTSYPLLLRFPDTHFAIKSSAYVQS